MRRHKSQTRDDIYLCDVAGARGRAETFGRLDLGRGPRVPVGAAGGRAGVRGAVESGARAGSGRQDPRIRPQLHARPPVP
jgi:hypothetical protein